MDNYARYDRCTSVKKQSIIQLFDYQNNTKLGSLVINNGVIIVTYLISLRLIYWKTLYIFVMIVVGGIVETVRNRLNCNPPRIR